MELSNAVIPYSIGFLGTFLFLLESGLVSALTL